MHRLPSIAGLTLRGAVLLSVAPAEAALFEPINQSRSVSAQEDLWRWEWDRCDDSGQTYLRQSPMGSSRDEKHAPADDFGRSEATVENSPYSSSVAKIRSIPARTRSTPT